MSFILCLLLLNVAKMPLCRYIALYILLYCKSFLLGLIVCQQLAVHILGVGSMCFRFIIHILVLHSSNVAVHLFNILCCI